MKILTTSKLKPLQDYIDEWNNEPKDVGDLVARDFLVDLILSVENSHKMNPKLAMAHIKNLYKMWILFCDKTATHKDDNTIEEYNKTLFGSAIVFLNQEADFGRTWCLMHKIPYSKDGIDLFASWMSEEEETENA